MRIRLPQPLRPGGRIVITIPDRRNPVIGKQSRPVPARRNAGSAWSSLRPDLRSEHIGWSKGGEFYCPQCSTIIGRNLRGQSPFALAARHVLDHKGSRTWGRKEATGRRNPAAARRRNHRRAGLRIWSQAPGDPWLAEYQKHGRWIRSFEWYRRPKDMKGKLRRWASKYAHAGITAWRIRRGSRIVWTVQAKRPAVPTAPARRNPVAARRRNPAWYVVRVDGSSTDTHAAATLAEARELAQADPGSRLEWGRVSAPDAGAARLMVPPGGWRVLGRRRRNPAGPGSRRPTVANYAPPPRCGGTAFFGAGSAPGFRNPETVHCRRCRKPIRVAAGGHRLEAIRRHYRRSHPRAWAESIRRGAATRRKRSNAQTAAPAGAA